MYCLFVVCVVCLLYHLCILFSILFIHVFIVFISSNPLYFGMDHNVWVAWVAAHRPDVGAQLPRQYIPGDVQSFSRRGIRGATEAHAGVGAKRPQSHGLPSVLICT